MQKCVMCPVKCKVNREISFGACGCSNDILVAHYGLHMWEEPCISGKNGSGAVFFAGCNLGCIFCQNYEISHKVRGSVFDIDGLITIFKEMEAIGAENINLVTPTHFSHKIRAALEKYKPKIPVVWNSSGYESVETLKSLEGLVDVYLPDMKFFSAEKSLRYCNKKDYFPVACEAVTEMSRQVGHAVFNSETMVIHKGLIVRCLVLPDNIIETEKILLWLKNNIPDVYVSLMSQYFPIKSLECEELNRKLRRKEYKRCINYMVDLGLNGFYQDMTSACDKYVPDFTSLYEKQ